MILISGIRRRCIYQYYGEGVTEEKLDTIEKALENMARKKL